MKMMKFYILLIISFALYSCGGSGDGFAPSLDLPSQAGPPVLVITPNATTVAVNNTVNFTASGGSGSYSYSIFSGAGSVLAVTGNFTAAASAGTAVVRVVDGQGQYADAIVTVNAALTISPTSKTLISNDTTTFSRTGGVAPFTYTLFSGVGSIDPLTGEYTAPAGTGAAVVRVTDSLGNTSNANVTVTNVLTISPSTPVYIDINGTMQFSATGGVPPNTYSCTNGGSSIDPSTGEYTAPATAGSDTCTVTDSTLATSQATVTIYNTFILSPTTVTLAVGATQLFTATGGVGAKTFSLVSGEGSIDSVSGLYTAPANATMAVIEVTDTIGNALQAEIEVVSTLTITPQNIYVPLGSTVNAFLATLGTGPYTFSVDSGGGSIVPGTGVYTAATTAGMGVVRVTDSLTTTDTTNVYHITPVDIKSSWSNHYCALYSSAEYSSYKLKCWGNNSSGELGYGDTNNRGDATSELGWGLKFVNVGTGKYVKKVAVGWYHTCAILDDNTVKCWGHNTYGQLGYGNTTVLGNASGQMGDALPTVNLGTGKTAKEIYAFGYRSCAILNDDTSKCWGLNTYGQLGQGNITNLGSGAGQMGDALAAINLGTGLYAVKLGGTENTTCAILNNGSLKCWGLGVSGGATYYGELGLETNNKTWGDGAGEMGDALPTVNLAFAGAATVTDISGSRDHYCALSSAGDVKCWGRNRYGALGLDNTTDKGATASSMGTNLPAVNLGSAATSLHMMRYASCAVLAGGAAKCWGYNRSGQLLQGISTATYLGDNAGEMAALAPMNLGTGRTVLKLAAGYYTACAILDNNQIKCWGTRSCSSTNATSASKGCLLNGSTTGANIGDSGAETGNSLPFVNH